MNSIDCVQQKGIIEEIKNGIATVNITTFSACASCQANGACGMSETAEKKVHVAVEGDLYKKGELVSVLMKKSLGLRATFLAYVVPFILIIAALIIMSSMGIKEFFAGIIALALLIPYYLILHIFKDRLQKTFQFTVNKVN